MNRSLFVYIVLFLAILSTSLESYAISAKAKARLAEAARLEAERIAKEEAILRSARPFIRKSFVGRTIKKIGSELAEFGGKAGLGLLAGKALSASAPYLAVGTVAAGLVAMPVAALGSAAEPINRKLDENQLAYFKRFWGFYADDSELVASIPAAFEEAARIVKEACARNSKTCDIQASRFFISDNPYFSLHYGKTPQENVFLIPADSFIQANPAQSIAHGILTQISYYEADAEVSQLVDDLAKRGQKIEYSQAAWIYAGNFLGLGSSWDITWKERFERYAQGAIQRRMQQIANSNALKDLNGEFFKYRVQELKLRVGSTQTIVTSCGAPRIQRFFNQPLAPCRSIPMERLMSQEVADKFLGLAADITKASISLDDKNARREFLGEMSLSVILGMAVQGLIFEKASVVLGAAKLGIKGIGYSLLTLGVDLSVTTGGIYALDKSEVLKTKPNPDVEKRYQYLSQFVDVEEYASEQQGNGAIKVEDLRARLEQLLFLAGIEETHRYLVGSPEGVSVQEVGSQNAFEVINLIESSVQR